MSGLKVRRLDSPLARAAPAHITETAPEQEEPTPAPETAAASSGERSLRVAPSASPERPGHESEPRALPGPPALNEGLELLSTRLPVSLRRSLHELTAALRARNGLVSQKGLPEQEVLALLIWAAGSPDDPQAVERLDGMLSEFRARRYTAAAQALRP